METILSNLQEEDTDSSISLPFFDDESKVVVESLGAPTDFDFEGFELPEQETTSDYALTCPINLQFDEWNDLDDSSTYTAETLPFDQNTSDLESPFHRISLPNEVEEEPPRKTGRRGRRPKAEALLYPCQPRGRKPKKNKLYEMAQPFEDELKEKRRQNAINAKKHRDQTKGRLHSLRSQIEDVKKETEELSRLSQRLTQNIESLKQLRDTCLGRVIAMASDFPQENHLLC